MKHIYSAFAVALLASCFSTLGGELSASIYSVTAIFAEGPLDDFVEAGWGFESNSLQSPVDCILPGTARVAVVRFPVLELEAGETGEIDNQKPVRYPNGWDINTGNPTGFDERGVGARIKATINPVTDALVNMSIEAENVYEPDWKTNELGYGLAPVLLPTFPTKSISMPGLNLYTGAWLVLGGVSTTTASQTNIAVKLIRVAKS